LVSFRGFSFKITFLHGEILKFYKFFFLKTLFHVNGKAIVTHHKDGDGKILVVVGLVIEIYFRSLIIVVVAIQRSNLENIFLRPF